MNRGTESEQSLELWIGLAAVALLVAGCLLILRPFMSAALWAAILCFTTWPMFLRLDAALGGRRSLAALVATLALAAIIAVCRPGANWFASRRSAAVSRPACNNESMPPPPGRSSSNGPSSPTPGFEADRAMKQISFARSARLIRPAGWPIEDTSTCHEGRTFGTDATETARTASGLAWRSANVTELHR